MKPQNNQKIYKFLNGVFKDLTLCLGGIFLLNQTEDKLIWTIAESLEEIYENSLKALKRLNPESPVKKKLTKDLNPHPAIEKFLARLEKEKREYLK